MSVSSIEYSTIREYAYESILEMYENHTNIMLQILPEAMFDRTEDPYKEESGLKRIIGYITKLIDTIADIISFAVRKIKALFKIFSIRAKDVQMGNKDFLAKYGKDLELVSHKYVNLDGFNMDMELVNSAHELKYGSDDIFKDLKMIILDDKIAFEDDSDIDAYIYENRNQILYGEADNSSSINDKEFAQRLHDKYYGTRPVKAFMVDDALDIIKRYSDSIRSIEKISSRIQKNSDADIKELNKLKNSFKQRGLAGRFRGNKDELVRQLTHLITYKRKSTEDLIRTFELIMRYVDECNIQAKTICIRALKEN